MVDGGGGQGSGMEGGGRRGGAKAKKTEFVITCFGIVCRSGFLTQFQRHGKTACDRCQKEENYTALEHCTRKSICQGFSFNMGDLKHLCVCSRMKLPWRCTVFKILKCGACRDVREWDRDVFILSAALFFWSWCVSRLKKTRYAQ